MIKRQIFRLKADAYFELREMKFIWKLYYFLAFPINLILVLTLTKFALIPFLFILIWNYFGLWVYFEFEKAKDKYKILQNSYNQLENSNYENSSKK